RCRAARRGIGRRHDGRLLALEFHAQPRGDLHQVVAGLVVDAPQAAEIGWRGRLLGRHLGGGEQQTGADEQGNGEAWRGHACLNGRSVNAMTRRPCKRVPALCSADELRHGCPGDCLAGGFMTMVAGSNETSQGKAMRLQSTGLVRVVPRGQGMRGRCFGAMLRRRSALLLALALAGLAPAAAVQARDPGAAPPLQFRVAEGRIENAFYQQGDIAAHLLLSSGDRPRVLVAFPAGNTGVGVWFEPTTAPVRWTLGEVRGLQRTVDGHAMNGIVAEASVSSAEPLVVKDAVLSSIRVLRDYQLEQVYPEQVAAAPQQADRSVRWQRRRLDGAPGYELALSTDNGRFQRDHGHLVLRPDHPGEALHLRIEASTGEPPLTPFAHLFNDRVQNDTRSQEVLRFLSYRQKFLAGSWRFDTYFGRDTLMSLRLLMPVLQPAAVDAGIASVLVRLAPDGEVAHEEGIGEFAVLDHLEKEGKRSDRPVYDYQMIDGNYMLAPVAAAWLLDDARGRAGAQAFLAEGKPGQRQGDALVRNLLYVAASSEAFVRQPVYANLIGLKPGSQVGQWRDSNAGIGGGRYPYDVNVVWVPAALRAIGRFLDAG